jgi:hypothetical protein
MVVGGAVVVVASVVTTVVSGGEVDVVASTTVVAGREVATVGGVVANDADGGVPWSLHAPSASRVTATRHRGVVLINQGP